MRLVARAAVMLLLAVILWAVSSGAPLGRSPALASVLTVTTTDDGNDGACDSHCTLREAIAFAGTGGSVEIPEGVYTVDSVLVIERDITIRGSDLGWSTIQAADQALVAESGVIEIPDGVVTAITGVEIRHGNSLADSAPSHDH